MSTQKQNFTKRPSIIQWQPGIYNTNINYNDFVNILHHILIFYMAIDFKWILVLRSRLIYNINSLFLQNVICVILNQDEHIPWPVRDGDPFTTSLSGFDAKKYFRFILNPIRSELNYAVQRILQCTKLFCNLWW